MGEVCPFLTNLYCIRIFEKAGVRLPFLLYIFVKIEIAVANVSLGPVSLPLLETTNSRRGF